MYMPFYERLRPPYIQKYSRACCHDRILHTNSVVRGGNRFIFTTPPSRRWTKPSIAKIHTSTSSAAPPPLRASKRKYPSNAFYYTRIGYSYISDGDLSRTSLEDEEIYGIFRNRAFDYCFFIEKQYSFYTRLAFSKSSRSHNVH